MNPFFQAMNQGNPMTPQVPQGMNPMRMMQQFQQFRQNFRGDPKAEVERMIQEGRITREQVEQARQMARQFGFLK